MMCCWQVRPEDWKVEVQEAASPHELLKQQQEAPPDDKATRYITWSNLHGHIIQGIWKPDKQLQRYAGKGG